MAAAAVAKVAEVREITRIERIGAHSHIRGLGKIDEDLLILRLLFRSGRQPGPPAEQSGDGGPDHGQEGGRSGGGDGQGRSVSCRLNYFRNIIDKIIEYQTSIFLQSL